MRSVCRSVLAALILAGLWVAPARAALAPVAIELADAAKIDAERITLGRIARIDTTDIQLDRHLEELVVGRAPMPGQKRRLDRRYLSLRLRQAGLAEEQIRFAGADAVLVTRATAVLTQDRIATLATDWVMAHQPYDPQRVRVATVQTSGDVDLPDGEIACHVEPAGRVDYLRPVALHLEIRVDGQPVKRAWATVTLAVTAPVVVSRRPLARYQTLTEDDVDVELIDLTTIAGEIISDPASVVGQRMRRSIGPRIPLRADLVEMPPLVRRGDVVTIVAESSGLRVTARGEVRSLGRRGERIGVMNLGSGKTVYARVIDGRTVRVEF